MQKPSEMKFFPINFTLFLEKKTISSTQLLHLNTHQNMDMLYLNLQGMWRFHANSSVFYSKRVMSDVMVLSYNGRGS